MIKPIYYNIFCSSIIAIGSFYTSFYIFRKERKEKKNKKAISFALFWLVTAFLWTCIVIYTILLPDINIFFVKASQVFVVFTFFAIVYHFSYKTWEGKKIGKLPIFGVSFIGLFYLILLFIYPVPEPIITDWGVAFHPPLNMTYVFFAIIFIIMGVIVYDLLQKIIFWIKNKKIVESYKFFATFSIFLYIFAGFFDEWAIHNGGIKLFLIRIVEMFAVLIAYLCYSRESLDDSFIENSSIENPALLNNRQLLK